MYRPSQKRDRFLLEEEVPPIEAQAKSNGGLERIAKALVLNSFRLSMLILPIKRIGLICCLRASLSGNQTIGAVIEETSAKALDH